VKPAVTTSVLRKESGQLKAALAKMMLENRLLKKSVLGPGGGRYMRYAASEKLEILRTVEDKSLGITRTHRAASQRNYSQRSKRGQNACFRICFLTD
jgi:hypothetical protein